ncbi:uncharacterized protein [Nicotiana tomentosiformis]|uniref:uncharacterized protein n=1 Tax=Nicotiana tomentosiformis TaxID=4098 RepID=UPI00388C8524
MVTYKGEEIMGEVNEMNQPRKYHNPEEQKMLKLSKDKRFPPKKPMSSEEAEEFFRKIKTSEYAIIDQLRKTPSQVSLLSLFISSNEHQKVLLKTLNEAYVPVEISVEQLERMAKQFFEVNKISFSRDDLPQEGAAHNKALHLTVKCEGYYMKRVMLDGGSGVDICPLSTLQRMKIRTERIRPNNVCVRTFDGVKRDTIGEIDLILTIGPVDFEVTFQVLDMDTSYNFFLGRPWIHTAGVVPSTLHQMVKFEHENQEIVVYGEDEQFFYRDPSVPCLEAREGSEHIVYQAFEIVIADQCEEGAPFPQPCLSNASVMVATEMIKHGVGFRATEADRKWADERRKNGWVLPQPVLYLTKSFIDPKYVEEEEEEEEETFMAEKIEDICEAMDVFAWSYDDMPGWGVDLVVHKLPTYPGYPPVQQKQRKFKTEISDKIKEEVSKQLKAGVIRVVRYTTWLANVVLVPKKDGKTRVCVDYRDLNKASPKDNFPLPNIHILIDNCAKHEIQSFVDCYGGYHQVLMDEYDAEKTAFTTPWGTYCYRVMPFGLKNIATLLHENHDCHLP